MVLSVEQEMEPPGESSGQKQVQRAPIAARQAAATSALRFSAAFCCFARFLSACCNDTMLFCCKLFSMLQLFFKPNFSRTRPSATDCRLNEVPES